jgi:hypothetical protein
MYIPSTDSNPLDQYVNTTGGGQSTPFSSSSQDMWRYTLYATPPGGSATQIATAVYGQNQPEMAGLWVTPPGFIFDTSSYAAGTQYTINVRTDNGSGSPGAGYDKNGYQLRAGPAYITNPTSTTSPFNGVQTDPYQSSNATYSSDPYTWLTNPATTAYTGTAPSGSQYTVKANTTLPDSTWSNLTTGYSSLAPMGTENYLSVTAYNAGTGPIYFGYAGPNPNTNAPTQITFNGFDEDTGASAIYYSCDEFPGVQFTGVLATNSGYSAGATGNGNGVWSPSLNTSPDTQAAPGTGSNTVFFPAGTYTGGNWTAWYTTGQQDVTTWNWTINYTTSNVGPPYLIYSPSTPGADY